jgi:hypothetical protein
VFYLFAPARFVVASDSEPTCELDYVPMLRIRYKAGLSKRTFKTETWVYV